MKTSEPGDRLVFLRRRGWKGPVIAVLLVPSIVTLMPLPASADAAVTLNTHGDSHIFPSWAFNGTTTLCVKSLDPNNDGKISIIAGAGHEDVWVKTGSPTCIERHWGGVKVGVTNTRDDMAKPVPVSVWTH